MGDIRRLMVKSLVIALTRLLSPNTELSLMYLIDLILVPYLT